MILSFSLWDLLTRWISRPCVEKKLVVVIQPGVLVSSPVRYSADTEYPLTLFGSRSFPGSGALSAKYELWGAFSLILELTYFKLDRGVELTETGISQFACVDMEWVLSVVNWTNKCYFWIHIVGNSCQRDEHFKHFSFFVVRKPIEFPLFETLTPADGLIVSRFL